MNLRMKRFFSGIMVLCLLFTLISPFQNVNASQKNYADMKGNPYETELLFALQNGLLVASKNKVYPNTVITKGAVCYALNQLLGATVPYSNMDSIHNIKPKDAYYKTMSIALNAGYISNAGKNEIYLPMVKANLNYIATVLSRVLDISRDEIIGANNPKSPITRAEFAAILSKYAPNIVTQNTTKVTKGNVFVNQPNVTLTNLIIDGDLIIGDGVADKEITLNNVTVNGKMIVRGGGENSIIMQRKTCIKTILVKQMNYPVSLKVSDYATVSAVTVDGSKDVNIKGTIQTLHVTSKNQSIRLEGGTIQNVVLSAPNIQLAVLSTSKIAELNITKNANSLEAAIGGSIASLKTDAANSLIVIEKTGIIDQIKTENNASQATIEVQKGAKIELITASGEGNTIKGEGSVQKVEVNGNNCTITVPGTEIAEKENVIGTVVENASGVIPTTAPTMIPTIPAPVPPTSGSSNGGNTGSSPSIPTVAPESTVTPAPTIIPEPTNVPVPTVIPEAIATLSQFSGATSDNEITLEIHGNGPFSSYNTTTEVYGWYHNRERNVSYKCFFTVDENRITAERINSYGNEMGYAGNEVFEVVNTENDTLTLKSLTDIYGTKNQEFIFETQSASETESPLSIFNGLTASGNIELEIHGTNITDNKVHGWYHNRALGVDYECFFNISDDIITVEYIPNEKYENNYKADEQFKILSFDKNSITLRCITNIYGEYGNEFTFCSIPPISATPDTDLNPSNPLLLFSSSTSDKNLTLDIHGTGTYSKYNSGNKIHGWYRNSTTGTAYECYFILNGSTITTQRIHNKNFEDNYLGNECFELLEFNNNSIKVRALTDYYNSMNQEYTFITDTDSSSTHPFSIFNELISSGNIELEVHGSTTSGSRVHGWYHNRALGVAYECFFIFNSDNTITAQYVSNPNYEHNYKGDETFEVISNGSNYIKLRSITDTYLESGKEYIFYTNDSSDGSSDNPLLKFNSSVSDGAINLLIHGNGEYSYMNRGNKIHGWYYNTKLDVAYECYYILNGNTVNVQRIPNIHGEQNYKGNEIFEITAITDNFIIIKSITDLYGCENNEFTLYFPQNTLSSEHPMSIFDGRTYSNNIILDVHGTNINNKVHGWYRNTALDVAYECYFSVDGDFLTAEHIKNENYEHNYRGDEVFKILSYDSNSITLRSITDFYQENENEYVFYSNPLLLFSDRTSDGNLSLDIHGTGKFSYMNRGNKIHGWYRNDSTNTAYECYFIYDGYNIVTQRIPNANYESGYLGNEKFSVISADGTGLIIKAETDLYGSQGQEFIFKVDNSSILDPNNPLLMFSGPTSDSNLTLVIHGSGEYSDMNQGNKIHGWYYNHALEVAYECHYILDNQIITIQRIPNENHEKNYNGDEKFELMAVSGSAITVKALTNLYDSKDQEFTFYTHSSEIYDYELNKFNAFYKYNNISLITTDHLKSMVQE